MLVNLIGQLRFCVFDIGPIILSDVLRFKLLSSLELLGNYYGETSCAMRAA